MDEQAAAGGAGLSLDQQAQAVAALQRALGAQLIETHISFVLLAGERAWKIKKAVDLGFLDFSTLCQREFFCREELRLNRRTAPGLYLDVMPLTGTPAQPRIGGGGAAIDWVLCMRAFAQDGLWDRMANDGRLLPRHIDAGVEALHALHGGAATADADAAWGQPAQVRAPLRDSLDALHALCPAPRERAQLDALARWEDLAFGGLQAVFSERCRLGRVRECHGDLHLGNIAQFEGRTTLFDALEFSAALRWTDVFSDLAFLAMDLHAHAAPRLAHRLVNAYVERSGDHAGMPVLRYYQVHRALVRAKVAALRDAQRAALGPPHGEAGRGLRRYLEAAMDFTHRRAPVLMYTHGFSGSGKTTLTQALLESCGALRIRADVERKRLFGLDALARSDAALKPQLYGEGATQATQAQLHALATRVLQSGYSVILDATFLARGQREAVRALADRLGVRSVLLHFEARASTLRQRVRARSASADDASEADLVVLEQQLAQAQPLQADELAAAYVVDAEASNDATTDAARWATLLQQLDAEPGTGRSA
jgi:aminoglycoside phosphotransferase family enzyme/predicted kinase